jgi:hypothetical protein
MRTTNFLTKTKGLGIALVLFAAVAFTGCDDDDDNINNNPYTLSGNATSGQMVPAGTATGTGNISGTYNPATRQMNFTSTWTGLTGAPTAGGFYYGASGTSGTAVGTPWTFGAGSTGTGSTTGTMTLTQAQETQLLNGDWYYSYGTAANSAGEIRGQMTATR